VSPDADVARSNGLRVHLTRQGVVRIIEVEGLGMVSGAPAGPVFALQPLHQTDRAAGRAPADHRYVSGAHLIPEAGASKSAVTQNVKRCRGELAQFYREINGHSPEDDLLVQNRKGRGYRLDPYATLVLNGTTSGPEAANGGAPDAAVNRCTQTPSRIR
jgi:hypothetical protein